jgi:anti-sigma B factor antagonist
LSTSFPSRQVSSVTIIDVSCPITFGEPSSEMRGAIATALKEGATKILLNLAEVNYMDSSGIGELLIGLRAARSRGSSLKLLNLSRRVQDLLKLTKVLTCFECFNDEPSAIASFP